jgi:membrane protein
MNLDSDALTAVGRRLWGSFVGRCVHRFLRMEGIDRALVLSSQAFTALIPLLIIVSTVAPPGRPDVVAERLIEKFGLTGESAAAVEQLFKIPETASGAISFGSAILLIYSGVSFTRRLQKMYRSAWEMEKAGLRGNMFAALGLVVLLVEFLLLYGIMSLIGDLTAGWVLGLVLSAIAGVVPWTSVPYLLLDRRVHWRRLLVAGGLAALAMAILGTATTVYMSALMERYVNDFGLFGITIAIIGWLLAAAGILVASTAIGAEFDISQAPWTMWIKRRYRLTQPEPPGLAAARQE